MTTGPQQPSWFARARAAHNPRELPEFISDEIGMFFHFLMLVAAWLAVVSVAGQALVECGFWLRDAAWRNYDWYWLFGAADGGPLFETGLKGFDSLIAWVLDCWITIPFGGLGLVIIGLEDLK